VNPGFGRNAVRFSASFVLATAVTTDTLAMPSSLSDFPTAETGRRATAAIKGHPAARKVSILPEESIDGKPSYIAHVLPLRASAAVSLKSLRIPRCDLLQSATDAVNAAINALAVLAKSLLDQANRTSELLEAHAEYVLGHADELSLASEGEAKIMAAEAVVTFLLGEIVIETDPELLAYYNAELVAAQREVSAARNDPAYMSAFSVKKQADALMDAALNQYEAWDLEYTTKLDGANAALTAAQSLYDDLSTTEIASVDARMPIWDPDVLSLLSTSGGVRGGVHFVPATLEGLRWSLQDAELPRVSPIEIEIYGVQQEELNGTARVEALPGIQEAPSGSRTRQLNTGDYGVINTVFARGTLGRTFSRETLALSATAPLIRASIPLGAYCGSLRSVQRTPSVVYGANTRASLLVTNYEFAPRARAKVESYRGSVDYEVKVKGPPTSVTCTLDLGAYAATSAGKSVDLRWLWQHYGDWDDLIVERLRKMGMHCSVQGAGQLRAVGADRVLRDALGWAVSDVWTLMRRYTNEAGRQVILPDIRVSSDDPRLAGQYAFCDGSTCQAPGLLPALAHSRAFGPRITGHCSWSSLFWMPAQLHSQIDFRMPQGL
jgi:hypothetical protein